MDNAQQYSAQTERRFEKPPRDLGTWSYEHRVALCLTIIVYLAAAIAFVSVRIAVGFDAPRLTQFRIDMELEQIDPQELAELEQEVMQQRRMLAGMDDFSDVRNLASNEAAREMGLNDRLRDAAGVNAAEVYDEAAAAQERMRANREAYEQGLDANEAFLGGASGAGGAGIGDGRAANRGGSGGGAGATGGAGGDGTRSGEDVRVKGRVTVSFSLVDPVRTSQKLVVPAYQCEGGGEVVVAITVDRSGYVISAAVDKRYSSSDPCMTSTAVEAARQSRFNFDASAPEKHQGTISYIFIPQ